MVQVEAMLCGTPVVITDIPGGREVVRVTGMGEIVPMGDHEALGRAVIKVLAEPGRYRRERAEIERSFSLTETVDRYERLLRGG
jgi:glycosyltransferase involved in cell wall biosynthesis